MIKKVITTISLIGIVLCSFATMSMASSQLNYLDYGNRYNGSYYYDIGWANVTVTGSGAITHVDVSLLKDGTWQATKRTTISGSSSGNTVTCYSYTLQGSGANGVKADRTDL